MTNQKYTNKLKAEIVEAHKQGKTVKDLCVEHDVPISTLYSWISKDKEEKVNSTISQFLSSSYIARKQLGMSVNWSKLGCLDTSVLKSFKSLCNMNGQLPKIRTIGNAASFSPSILSQYSHLGKKVKMLCNIDRQLLRIGTLSSLSLVNRLDLKDHIGLGSAFKPLSKAYVKVPKISISNVISSDVSKYFKSFKMQQATQLINFKKAFENSSSPLSKAAGVILRDILTNPLTTHEYLTPYGWFIHLDMPYRFLKHIDIMLEDKNQDAIDDYLTRYYITCFEELFEYLLERHAVRKHILLEIKQAYIQKLYYIAISTILTQVDGICYDAANICFFKKNKKYQPVITKELLKDSSNSDQRWLLPITNNNPIFSHENYLSDFKSTFNRHRVIHGNDLSYGTQQNFLKAFSFFAYMSDALLSFYDNEEGKQDVEI